MIPKNGFIILRTKKTEEMTPGGIMLVKGDIDQDTLGFGAVEAVCAGSEFKTGDEVIFCKWSPVEWKLGGESFYSIQESEIIAVL